VDDRWTTTIIIVAASLAVIAVWFVFQARRLRARLAEVDKSLTARTVELESAQLDLQRLSTEDGLTALANHEQFLDFLEREWRRARRDADPVSIIFFDVDGFRAFNRQYGRRAGDDCLRQIGQAIEGIAGRAGDLVARYHRDEFAVVLSRTDSKGALRVANRIREAIERLAIPAARDGERPVVTASIAVASAVPARQSTWEELDLIKVARHALSEARRSGGNRVNTALLEVPSSFRGSAAANE
jgi:diguanylate cyclase (GGDEF)-like protein